MHSPSKQKLSVFALSRFMLTLLFISSSVGIAKAKSAEPEEKVVSAPAIVSAADVKESDYDVKDDKTSSVPKPLYEYKQESAQGKGWVPPSESYPDGALHKAYLEELSEQRKTEEMQHQADLKHENYEKKKVEVEREVAIKSQKIQGYKVKQDQLQTDLETMESDLATINGQKADAERELSLVDKRLQMETSTTDASRRDLNKSKATLNVTLEGLRKSQEKATYAINKTQIDGQKIRAEVAQTETEIARAENDTARAQAEELKARSDLAVMQMKLMQARSNKERALSELYDMKKNLNEARGDYRLVRSEYDQAEHELLVTENKIRAEKVAISGEMKSLENLSAQAVSGKANAEAEKARFEAEETQLKQNLELVRSRNQESLAQMNQENSVVMESRLSFETAKADLAKEMSFGESARLKQDTIAVKNRSLASVVESSGVTEGRKSWTMNKDCHIRREPSMAGAVLGHVRLGERVVAVQSENGFVKILNNSGAPAYIHQSCGNFSN